jgi:hypothetical protein
MKAQNSAPAPKHPSRADTIVLWGQIFGVSPPKGISTKLLELAVAYAEQSKIHGGLKSKTANRLKAFPASETVRSPRSVPIPRRSRLAPGTRLVREWHGRQHVVEVQENGVFYNGDSYRSLSQVARTITGARWSGPRFFGL